MALLEVATNAYGRKVKIPVEISRYPFRVESFQRSSVIRLPVKRQNYNGPLDIELKNLPSGIDSVNRFQRVVRRFPWLSR